MSAADKSKVDYLSVGYATCDTAAATKDKVATLDSTTKGFSLTKGAIVFVKYTNANTYSATTDNPITLNVGNTGAKQIRAYNNTIATGTNQSVYGKANYTMVYMYDGTY